MKLQVRCVFALSILLCCGCGGLFTKTIYNRRIPKLPPIKQPAFDDLRSLSAAETTSFLIGDEIMYQMKYNFEELDQDELIKLSEINRNLDLRKLATLNVNTENIDYDDTEGVEDLFARLEESGRNKQQLEYDRQRERLEYERQLSEKEKFIRDKEAEKEGWKMTFFKFAGGWIFFLIALFVGIGILQFYTGIPIFKIIFSGGRVLHNGLKQSVSAIQSIRSSFANDANGGMKESAHKWTDDEIAVIQKYASVKLDEIDGKLSHYQDEKVKKQIKQIKSKYGIGGLEH